MENRSKSMLAILLGVLIILADLYWIYINPQALVLGFIILLASIIWIALDYLLMSGSKIKNVMLLSWLTILMGLVIVVVDLYWSYLSLSYTVGLGLGIVIFVFNIAWLYLEYNLMSGTKATAVAAALFALIILASLVVGGFYESKTLSGTGSQLSQQGSSTIYQYTTQSSASTTVQTTTIQPTGGNSTVATSVATTSATSTASTTSPPTTAKTTVSSWG
ncbi:MAG: hypothetical protein KGH94_04255 [Candidatus Micrarchaeota archaeon]|nr:hypothetical protein [Candidatus Micrarchaeota archaeon]